MIKIVYDGLDTIHKLWIIFSKSKRILDTYKFDLYLTFLSNDRILECSF